MTEVEPSSIELDEGMEQSITFCEGVGLSGVGLYALSLFLGAIHFYIYLEFTQGFKLMTRNGVWIFAVFGSFFFTLIFHHLFTWKKNVEKTLLIAGPDTDSEKTCIRTLCELMSKFEINGKWFLIYMLFCEMCDSLMQMYNIIVLYTCSLPPEVVLTLCLLLTIDEGYKLYSLWQPVSVSKRDTQLTIDLCVDLLCMILPLTVLFFGFGIPLTISDMLCIVTMPTILTISRLKELMVENTLRRSAMKKQVNQTKRNMIDVRRTRTRTVVEVGIQEQEKSVGRRMKLIMTVFSTVSVFFFFVTGILTVSISNECDELLYRSCVVKVPFCKLKASCNCVILSLVPRILKGI